MHSFRLVLLMVNTFVLAGFCLGQAQGHQDAPLEAFFRQYLDESFRLQPSRATELGDHRYDSELEDLSPASREKWLEHARETLKRLPRQVEKARLSHAGQIDYEILEHHLNETIWLTENFRPFEEDPRIYSGYITDPVYLLLTQSSLSAETNVANSISRMSRIPQVLKSARENLKNPPRTHTETAIQQNLGAIRFYERGLYDFAGETPQTSALRTAADPVVAALKDYQSFLENELLPRASGDWRIGKKLFGRKLKLTLNSGAIADQVLSDAEDEFERVQSQMYVIARQLWAKYYPGKVLPPDDLMGRRETVRRVLERIGNEHGNPETLTSDVRNTVSALKRFIAAHDILRLPTPDTCQIVEMPEFRRGNSTAYMQSPPPLDPNTPGYFAVSPPPKAWDTEKVRSYLQEYNRYMNQILTIHEAYPGHYVQHEYANKHASLIRRVLASGVYVEGWAVYTEQTLLDQGYGEGDLALRLTQLKFYLRAVANAILDHRMHCNDMTDEAALEFLVGQAYQSEGEARLKVIRAKQSSVQLSTYFVGRMAMHRLRHEMQRSMGERFALGAYHEAVLKAGPVPVKYLPGLVKKHL